MCLRVAEFLSQHYLAGDFGMQDNGALVGPARRPGDEPKPGLAGRRGAGVIQIELRNRAAQHGVDSDGRVQGVFGECAPGAPADFQVVDARPATAEAGAVFAREAVPRLVGEDDPPAAIQQADPFAQRIEGKAG